MTASYTFQDLSGAAPMPATGENPYQYLITACDNDPIQIRKCYVAQRNVRNEQKRAELLSPDFPGVNIDQILARIEDPTLEPGFEDWRNCLVFWARPPSHIKTLISQIQQRLKARCPNIWTMPPDNLHMTVLEVAHSLTPEEIEKLVQQVEAHVEKITDFTHANRARLVRPMLNYDNQSLALQFLPAIGEAGRSLDEDAYTYHHLRRDVFDLVKNASVEVGSRYVTPSAHLTIARFTTTKDLEGADGEVDHEKIEQLVIEIDGINEWIREEYWYPEVGSKEGAPGEWVVGHEKGLDCRRGTLWYGGGETIRLGKGF